MSLTFRRSDDGFLDGVQLSEVISYMDLQPACGCGGCGYLDGPGQSKPSPFSEWSWNPAVEGKVDPTSCRKRRPTLGQSAGTAHGLKQAS